MRRISIASANAFILVYACDDVVSFRNVRSSLKTTCYTIYAQMSDLFDEIVKLRQREMESIPIVVAGNKHELPNLKASS